MLRLDDHSRQEIRHDLVELLKANPLGLSTREIQRQRDIAIPRRAQLSLCQLLPLLNALRAEGLVQAKVRGCGMHWRIVRP